MLRTLDSTHQKELKKDGKYFCTERGGGGEFQISPNSKCVEYNNSYHYDLEF